MPADLLFHLAMAFQHSIFQVYSSQVSFFFFVCVDSLWLMALIHRALAHDLIIFNSPYTQYSIRAAAITTKPTNNTPTIEHSSKGITG